MAQVLCHLRGFKIQAALTVDFFFLCISGADWWRVPADRRADEQLHKQRDQQGVHPHPVQLGVPQPPPLQGLRFQQWRGVWRRIRRGVTVKFRLSCTLGDHDQATMICGDDLTRREFNCSSGSSSNTEAWNGGKEVVSGYSRCSSAVRLAF